MGTIQSSFYRIKSLPLMMQPVTFILGATGTGKSDLAVALAKRFNGEVINADAMQLYQGLDIVTNKITEEEQEGVPHHLLGILTPNSLSYTIHDYKREASAIIQRIFSEGKMPIVVGGTNYYADCLMWDSLIPKHEQQTSPSSRFVPEDSSVNQHTLSFMFEAKGIQGETQDKLSALSNHEMMDMIKELDTNYMRLHIEKVNSVRLHQLLMGVDPDTARTIHPNQARKIVRALEILKHHGKKQSDFLSEINEQAGDQRFGASLTYPNTTVIWLRCEQEVLNSRLKRRVDKMIERGLLEELAAFHADHNSPLLSQSADKSHGDYTRGIFQCIGFKEFHSYLLLPESDKSSSKGQKLLAEGITAMQFATIRYAKYQNKWVKKQVFEQRNPEVVPPVYVFDSTNRNSYRTDVVVPAITLLEEILRGDTPSISRHTMETQAKESNKVVFETCVACEVTCVREREWQAHIRSRKHHKRLASVRRAEERLRKEYGALSETLSKHEDKLSQMCSSTETCGGAS